MRRCAVFAFACVLCLAGCKKTIGGSELYAFRTNHALWNSSTVCSQGEETAFEIGSKDYDPKDLSTAPVIAWFYNLEVTACDEPEAVEGAESYTFQVEGEYAFYLRTGAAKRI